MLPRTCGHGGRRPAGRRARSLPPQRGTASAAAAPSLRSSRLTRLATAGARRATTRWRRPPPARARRRRRGGRRPGLRQGRRQGASTRWEGRRAAPLRRREGCREAASAPAGGPLGPIARRGAAGRAARTSHLASCRRTGAPARRLPRWPSFAWWQHASPEGVHPWTYCSLHHTAPHCTFVWVGTLSPAGAQAGLLRTPAVPAWPSRTGLLHPHR